MARMTLVLILRDDAKDCAKTTLSQRSAKLPENPAAGRPLEIMS
jgi:hypothetical protein